MGARVWSTAGHARLSSRSLELPRRVSGQPRRGRDKAEGDPVLQPDPSEHGPIQAHATNALRSRDSYGEAARGPNNERGGPDPSFLRGPQALQNRASDLSLQALRG